MIVALPTDNESERLEALAACQILDTPADPRFDDLAALAAQICQTPIALVSLVDDHRQWFKAKVGVTACETSRDWAFCAHALHEQDILVVPDAMEDERFVTNPLVTGDPNIRFYAGVPLRINNGLALGTLCVIDRVPRELTQEQLNALAMLARQVVAQIELHRHVREQENVITRQEHRLILELENKKNQEFFELIVEAAPSGMIMIDQQGTIVLANHLITQQFGYTQEELVGQSVKVLLPERFRMAHPTQRDDFFDFPQSRRMGQTRELFGLRKDGTEFPLEIGLNPIETPKGVFVLSAIVDISERKQAEADKERLNEELVKTSRRAGMADVATNVLHNVGNVLNSVNVSAGMVRQAIRRLSVDKISRTATMINEHTENLGAFLKEDSKGQHIPEYLTKLGDHLIDEQTQVLSEMEELNKNIEHINEIVSAQQNMAKSGGVLEPINPQEVMEQAIAVNLASMMRHGIEIVRDFRYFSEIIADKHQVLQILINLISNAKYAIIEKEEPPSRMTLEVSQAEGRDGYVLWRVTDTGKGITPEHMPRIFSQGFTTKKTGHGFGLHSAALSANLMGGSLSVHSDGENQGATFTLELPMTPVEVFPN